MGAMWAFRLAPQMESILKMSSETDKVEAGGNAAPQKGGGGLLMRFTGALLVVAAVFLWHRDFRDAKRRSDAASALRYVANTSILGMGLRASPRQGGAEPALYEPCSPEVASNILVRLAMAEPVKTPKFDETANAYDMFLFLTNRARVFLRARRSVKSDETYVALLESRRNSGFGSNGGQFSLVECEPALVTGLGAIFDEIDSGDLSVLRSARVILPPGFKAWTNLVRRAGVAGLDEESLKSTETALRAIVSSAKVVGCGLSEGAVVGREKSVVHRVGAETAAKVAQALAGAERAETPSGTIEGEEYGLVIAFDEGFAVNLRVAVADAEPQDALVGFVDFLAAGDGGEAPKAVVSAPARVSGLGALISSIRAEEKGGGAARAGAPE